MAKQTQTRAERYGVKEGTVFTVCDGELVLELTVAEKGWYAVTSPLEPGVNTQAKSIEEAFYMARDAMQGLREVRAKHHEAVEAAARAA